MPDSWADASGNYHLFMAFSGAVGGWSESHLLPATTPADALTQAATIVGYRLACLPGSLNLIWAKVGVFGKPRDRRAVQLSYPKAGTYDPTSGSPAVPVPGARVPNLESDAVFYTRETQYGAFANPFLHGVPDKEVSNEVLAAAITVPTVAPVAVDDVAFPAAWEDRVGAYFYILKANTKFFRESVDTGSGATLLLMTDVAAIIPRKIGPKKVGRPFGQQRGRAVPR